MLKETKFAKIWSAARFEDAVEECVRCMTKKRKLASSALWPMGDTEGDAATLQELIYHGSDAESGDPVNVAISRMFARDGVPVPHVNEDGSIMYS